MTSSAENVRDTLVRLQERLAPDRLAALREIHSSTGKHEPKGIPFTDWVPAGVSEEARLIVGRSFWFRWLVASAVGSGVGVVAWVSVGTAAEAIALTPQSGFSRALIPALVGAAFGAPFGIAQWIVLRRHLQLVGRWVTATTLGYAAVFLLGGLFFSGEGAVDLPPGQQVLLGALLGAAVAVPPSVLQWLLVLRSQLIRAGSWIVASVFSWALGFAGSFLLRLVLGDPSFVLGPIVAVALSGNVMVWLLRGERQ